MEYKKPDIEHDSGREKDCWKCLQGKGLRFFPANIEKRIGNLRFSCVSEIFFSEFPYTVKDYGSRTYGGADVKWAI